MFIHDNILKHYLRNCYFINGTAYAGKSTMCAMLAERYGMIHCEENYNLDTILSIALPETHPNICYMNTKPSWQHFVSRTPEEYEAWIDGNTQEMQEFEVAELIRLSSERKVIVDTNIPCKTLWKISDYDHVAILLSPQAMSVDHFFDREDPDKQFLLSVIHSCPDPEATLENFRNCIARINSPERYQAFCDSGFFTLIRQNDGRDTREEMLCALAAHFKLD
ncbi:MAG: hypothetical protein KIG74_02340 [Clostridiaceae bacterium]|nr:hypothetical protein [Clostridiaceae bacterium]